MENIIPFGDTEHAYPEVYNTIPKQPTEVKPGQLTEKQLHEFFEEGFLTVENYFDHAVLDKAKSSIDEMVDKFADTLHKAGKLTNLYKEYGLYQRVSKIESEVPSVSMLLTKLGHLSEPFKTIWTDPKLLNMMEQLIGSQDIQGHPVWNLRTKTPQKEAFVVPWHQDVGYLDNDSHDVMQVTAWIPFLDANANNGCVQVLRKGHKTGKVIPHYGCWRTTHYVETLEEEMESTLGINVKDNTVTCEVPYGGMLLFSNILPHRSLPNMSNDTRWSLDLRWQRTDKSVGFYGLKNGVPMRSSTNPHMEVNWKDFDGNPSLEDSMNALTKNGTVSDPDSPGPWMTKWKITNKNRHVEALEKMIATTGEVSLAWHPKKVATNN